MAMNVVFPLCGSVNTGLGTSYKQGVAFLLPVVTVSPSAA